MRGSDHLAQFVALCEDLLAEAREVAVRVSARVEEVRRRFPDDENLTDHLTAELASPQPGEGVEVGGDEPAGR